MKSNNCKGRILTDLDGLLTSDDSSFLSSILEEPEESFKIFAIRQAGKIQDETLYPKVKKMISEEKNERLLKFAINSIGRYKKTENISILLNSLNHKKQSVRFATIEALGLMADNRIIEPLKAVYANEESRHNRLAMIEAVSGTKDKNKRNEVLDYFESVENIPNVKKYIRNKKDN